MGVKHWVRAILAVSVLPSAVWALGLGDIRLKSALNAPLDAEIEVVNASPEEMAGLKANLANRETFARYGLEWPSFLASVSLSKAKDAEGRDILRLRSSEAITEPFVTLLVDANWGRGRLVREYTVLLDPPVFAPTPAPAAVVQAPATAAPRSGAVERAPVPAAPQPATAPAEIAPATSADSYRVQRGETLTGIAERYAARNGVSLEQAMVGIFAANRAAFDGNMDRMRAGAVLRVDPAQMAALSREAAVAEVRRQRSEWRSRPADSDAGPAAAGGDAGRLRLVPPGQAAGEGGAAGATQGAALRQRVAQLEQELAEARRLIELRSTEIADLQRRLGGAPAAAPATPSTGVAVEAPAATAPAGAPEAPPAAAAAEAPASAAPPVAAAAEPEAAAAPMRPRFQPEPQAETSLLDGVLGALRDFWYVPVALLALLGGLFGYRRWKARAGEGDDDFTITSARPELAMPPPVVPAAAASDTARLRRPNLAAVDSEGGSFVVEEEGQPAARGRSDATATVRTALPEATLSGDTGLNLDQGDPLAEADFHMAYGLYDQAADLVKLAIGREPDRRDLKLKLAEVYFVWGNRDEFLATVRELEQSNIRSAPGEWEKIAIMGRQIAPDDPTFAPTSSRAPGGGLPAVDLALDGAEEAALDFEVVGDEAVAGGGGTLTDIDVGRSSAPVFDVGGGTTREMAPRFAASAGGAAAALAAEEFAPGALDIDFGESPTVEQPRVRADTSPTIREKLDAALLKGPGGGVDQTAELALDDLGLDLGSDVQGLEQADAAADAPTEIVGLDEELARLAERGARATPVPTDDGATVAMEGLTEIAPALPDAGPLARSGATTPGLEGRDARLGDDGEIDLGATANRSGDTSIVAALDLSQFERDFDVPPPAQARGPAEARGDGAGIDLDVGTATLPELSDTARSPAIQAPDAAGAPAADLGLAPLEPVTISEVGTKLDLARAYMDMGDPDGARSILKEVLGEGSVSQKQEAQRLIESLPG
jgi:pilus assembly protein FimV